MTKYQMVALATLTLAAFLPSFGQSGPQGDKSVGAFEEARSSAHPAAVLPAKIGDSTEQVPIMYSLGPSDRTAWALEYKVENVREMWLKSDKQNSADVGLVRKSALLYANALARIPDRRLNLGGLIIKDEYACFGYVIAGANTVSKSSQRLLAEKAEHFCQVAALQLAKADEPADNNARAVREWEIQSDEHPRIAYLLAMSKCLKGASLGDNRPEKEARDILSSNIPSYYLERFPPQDDYVLRACVNH